MIDVDSLGGRRGLLLAGAGVGALALVILVSQNRKQQAMLSELRKIRLLNHPHFDVSTGEFNPPEGVQESIEQEADAE
jgi:hypothetical protein